MTLVLAGWAFAVFAGVAAVLLFGRSRALGDRARALGGRIEEVRAELQAARGNLEQRKEEHRRRGEELSELRKQLGKAKKERRSARERQRGEPARIEELERALSVQRDDVARARADLEEAHSELAKVHALRERELEVARAPRTEVDERLRDLEARLGRAEAALRTSVEEHTADRHELGRWRKRAENLDKVYMVLCGEHELAKDRLRTQEAELERLRALKVALVDPVPETTEG